MMSCLGDVASATTISWLSWIPSTVIRAQNSQSYSFNKLPVNFSFRFFFVACSIDGILGMYSVLLLPLTTVVIDGNFI